jgi:hypothetical protein
LFDMAAKLGYQFVSSENTELTPYATLGYHRWSQNYQGQRIPGDGLNGITNSYYIDGAVQTWQHTWYGVGLLAQWSVSPVFVLSADGNVGRTYNASMHGWAPVNNPVDTTYTIANTTYEMASLGADYRLAKNWHALANLSYWRYRYDPSGSNVFGISTVTANAHQLGVNVGLGYALA